MCNTIKEIAQKCEQLQNSSDIEKYLESIFEVGSISGGSMREKTTEIEVLVSPKGKSMNDKVFVIFTA